MENIITDYMGIPLSRSEALDQIEALKRHLEFTPEELCEVGNLAFAKHMPSMHRDFPMLPEKFK